MEPRGVAKIAVVTRVSGFAGFRGVDNIDEFAGGDVMKLKAGMTGGKMGEGAVKLVHLLTKEHVHVFRDATVGVKLCKNPFGAALDVNIKFEPKPEACGGRGVARSEIGVLNARENAPFTAVPVEAEGALN